jgi:serine/threonine protein kinase
VHKNKIKVADFGLSKEESEESSSDTSRIFGIIPYIDPKHFTIENYKLNKKSDIYSIGILLWQISSGRRPFCDINYDIKLSLEIINGKREKIIEGTPDEYTKIYTGNL